MVFALYDQRWKLNCKMHAPYVELFQQRGQRLAQSLNSKLAGTVHAAERNSHNSAHATNIHYVPFLSRLHFREHGLCDAKKSKKVRVETALHGLHSLALQCSTEINTSVIHCCHVKIIMASVGLSLFWFDKFSWILRTTQKWLIEIFLAAVHDRSPGCFSEKKKNFAINFH